MQRPHVHPLDVFDVVVACGMGIDRRALDGDLRFAADRALLFLAVFLFSGTTE